MPSLAWPGNGHKPGTLLKANAGHLKAAIKIAAIFRSPAMVSDGVLWAGADCAKGGQCLVAWSDVCTPVQHGGLGLHVQPQFSQRRAAIQMAMAGKTL